jgi:hypothetical protein
MFAAGGLLVDAKVLLRGGTFIDLDRDYFATPHTVHVTEDMCNQDPENLSQSWSDP